MERRNFIKNTALIGATTAAATTALSSPALAQSKKNGLLYPHLVKRGFLVKRWMVLLIQLVKCPVAGLLSKPITPVN